MDALPLLTDLSLYDLLLFALAGVFTGIINTLAGSGSLITLPIFIFICGLPASVANATNRVGVLLQSTVATNRFAKTMPGVFKGVEWLAIPAILGALLGSWIAVDLDEKWMNYSIGTLMIIMLVILLFKPQRWLKPESGDAVKMKSWKSLSVFFLIGVYGGFLQAGVGVFLLAAMVLVSGFNLKRANGVKLLMVFIFTIPSLLVFIYYGKVVWLYGLLMGTFQSVGAWLGVKFIAKIPNAEVWIYRVLIVVVAVSAAKFFL
ncbi:sulfite exporter TauE/SafE family protein [Marinilongibacter aquaticus]|uniref:sulfite exporter TauE/SafE family protein n=1 Tax=Marinilongibacter aquaticus TaxID=2975157 RepID=UPI0021BD7D48|nr:sulfite exporter TauE/SafE family protein [Marinilongibacter aquaticus]UBM58141.1 sulfite exporter TauE/SafE family protein [Marinilongibacter aquaticus]